MKGFGFSAAPGKAEGEQSSEGSAELLHFTEDFRLQSVLSLPVQSAVSILVFAEISPD